jgi:hypothetical protein
MGQNQLGLFVCLYIYLFVVLVIELRALSLLASTLPLETCPQPFWFYFVFQIGSHNNLPGLASDDSPTSAS